MAMTEALAATGAQTIPVFALAGVLEARAVISTSQARSATKDAVRRRPAQIIGRIVAIIALYTLGLCNLIAELYCLDVLGGDPPDPEAQGFVYLAIMGSLVFLVVFPAVHLNERSGTAAGDTEQARRGTSRLENFGIQGSRTTRR